MSTVTGADRAADRAYIANTEAQIAALTSSIRGLRADISGAQERLASYVYPVLTLPNEIMSEIFVHFLPVYPRCPPHTGCLSPTLLTHICRKWREIALTTPALWRAISLTYYSNEGRQIPILESWLGRSGRLPLSLDMEDLFVPITKECLELLVLHSTRWEHIKLAVEAPADLLTIQSMMPLLRQLELYVAGGGSLPSPASYREVPRLRSATLWDFPYPADFLPWSQLTSLTLVCQSPTEFTAVLQHTVNLVHCDLVPLADSVRQPDIKLERLKSLVLTKYVAGDDPTQQYLDTLITPALRTLEVPDEFLRPDPIVTLTSFIAKSGCQLKNMCITGARSKTKRLYRAAFPSIPNLSFDSATATYFNIHHHI
ncbi:hypothetical protein FB451DRAFT_1238322 [Mycena latifolia]|nr:hypothetical protein FB451DRAFT_1238322 [Mycena latifolia]